MDISRNKVLGSGHYKCRVTGWKGFSRGTKTCGYIISGYQTLHNYILHNIHCILNNIYHNYILHITQFRTTFRGFLTQIEEIRENYQNLTTENSMVKMFM